MTTAGHAPPTGVPWTESERAANIEQVVSWTTDQRAAFVERERRALEHYVKLFVHADERAGMLERAAASWVWSSGAGPGMDPLVVAFTRARLSVSRPQTVPFVEPLLVYEWMSEGFTRSKAGAGLVHDEAQLAGVFLALPEPVRQARATRLLLDRIPTADLQRYLIDVIAAPVIARLVTDGSVGDGVAGLLAESVRSHIGSFGKSIQPLLRTPAPQTTADANALATRLDSAFADFVKKLGEQGRTQAAAVRKSSSKRAENQEPRWRLWLPEPDGPDGELFLLRLAEVLWIDEVKPNLGKRAGVVRAVATDRLLSLMTKQVELPELDDGVVRDGDGRPLAHIALTTNATLEAVRSGAHALGTVTGHRLIRSLIHRSHEAWVRGDQDPRKVAFSGGWSGLMEMLGVSDKHHATLKQIAEAGQCIMWETPHAKYGGLWTFGERRGSRDKPGEVSFVLGDALTPGYGLIMKLGKDNSAAARMARRLIPELRYEPPMGGARSPDQGPLWTLHRLMMVDMVDYADELHADGGVLITPERWRELARAAGVGASIIPRTLDAWVAGESEAAPPLIEQVEPDRWTLAKPHAPERDFIAAGGAKRAAGKRRRRRRK